VYYPGWRVTVDGHPGEILRTNRAMRGVVLGAGVHQLVFRYEPLTFHIGLAVSALGLAVLAVLGVWTRRGAVRFAGPREIDQDGLTRPVARDGGIIHGQEAAEEGARTQGGNRRARGSGRAADG
jgi:hypothetical protein